MFAPVPFNANNAPAIMVPVMAVVRDGGTQV